MAFSVESTSDGNLQSLRFRVFQQNRPEADLEVICGTRLLYPKLGLEGVIGKKAKSGYLRGRTTNWVKVKMARGRHIDEEREVEGFSKWPQHRAAM